MKDRVALSNSTPYLHQKRKGNEQNCGSKSFSAQARQYFGYKFYFKGIMKLCGINMHWLLESG